MKKAFAAAGLAFVLLASCASTDYVFRTKAEDWDGRPYAGLQLAKPEDGAAGNGGTAGGERKPAELTSSLFPRIVFKGEIAAEAGGDVVFVVTEARLFDNWQNGWTEGFYEASGVLRFKKGAASSNAAEETLAVLEDPIRLWGIKSGEIRYIDTYYRRDDGLKKVKQRVDRMSELSKFMRKDLSFRTLYVEVEKDDEPFVDFREDCLRLLFPEREDFEDLEAEGRLAAGFKTVPEAVETVRGDGLLWRKDYSAAVLPENFRDLRDSGTLYRDFEEAPGLWLSLYNLEHLSELLKNGEFFIRQNDKG